MIRVGDVILYDRPQEIPCERDDGLIGTVITPTPWRTRFAWYPLRAVVNENTRRRHGWVWLKRVEWRRHFGSRRGESVLEVRVLHRPAKALTRATSET
ncbi:MAG: hypothetical protein O9284_04655 [Steroidobacteraceae bacterium]|jgi:hypothetical protein|nr:hypothetical protein [Steroidobacteraceae bacterium]